MKRITVYSLLFIILCSTTFGANEIRSFEAGATTCYAVVREIDGDVWYVAGQVFEVWGTGARTAADYDIALTNKTGGMFVGNFDANIAAGSYHVVTHNQAGGAPADTDPAVWEDYGYWSGVVWTSGSDASDIDAILVDTGTTLPATLTTMDGKLDTIVTNTEAYDTDAEYAAAIWGALIAGYTSEATFGGELQSLDPNITLILEDTGTTIPTLIAAIPTVDGLADAVWDEAMAGHTGEATFGGELQTLDPNITLILADTDELQTDWTDGGRLDLLIDAIKAITDLLPVVTTTVSDANDANSFTLTAGKTSTDAYMGHVIRVTDATDGSAESRLIIYWSSARVVEVDMPFTFTPDVADNVTIWSVCYLGELLEDILRAGSPPIVVDRRASTTGGGTPTVDWMGEDP